jgi:hypothetical protein
VLALHGSVAVTSVSYFWRQGTALGFNDDILAASNSPRPCGPAARRVLGIGASGRPDNPPLWNVRIHDRHVEFVDSGAQASPVSLQAPAARSASAAAQTEAATSDGNHAVGQRCQQVFARLVAQISCPGTSPAAADEVFAMVAKFETDAMTALSRGTLTKSAPHAGATVTTAMRPAAPGPGSSARTKGAHEN